MWVVLSPSSYDSGEYETYQEALEAYNKRKAHNAHATIYLAQVFRKVGYSYKEEIFK